MIVPKNVKKFSLGVEYLLHVFDNLPNYWHKVSLSFPQCVYFILSASVASNRISQAVVNFFEMLSESLKRATLRGI